MNVPCEHIALNTVSLTISQVSFVSLFPLGQADLEFLVDTTVRTESGLVLVV